MDRQTDMKYLISLLALFGLVLLATAAEDTYDTKYDNVDIDEILHNDRLYKKYYDCLTGEGKCTPDGKLLKDLIPDALSNKCAKCSAKQKAGVEKTLRFLIKEKPEDWARLEKIYDPEGKFKALYKEDANTKYGIDLS